MSRLSDYYSRLDSESPGWNKENHKNALSDTMSCLASLGSGSRLDRMVAMMKCNREKGIARKRAKAGV